jgi:hypothetical protein
LPRRTDYDAQASRFASTLSDLLNGTITTGIRIRSVLADRGTYGWVGYEIGPQDPVGQLIPVKPGKGPPSCWLYVNMTLTLDPEVRQLIAKSSRMGAYCHNNVESMIVHYDFDREPGNDYVQPHVQVAGASQPIAELCERHGLTTPLERFHFPVGGKRYRPTVEDLVEFVVIERIAKPRAGWRDVVQRHRDQWERIQLKSVVRRDPETAATELRRKGYTVEPPPPPGV